MRSTLTVLDHHNNTSTLSFKLDTGAEVNVLPLSLYKQMRLAPFLSTSTVLRGFGNALIKPLGTVDMIVCDRTDRKFSLIFFVTDIIHTPILGEHACELLNLVKKIDDILEFSNLTLDMVTNNFLEVFSGTGLYKEKYNITLWRPISWRARKTHVTRDVGAQACVKTLTMILYARSLFELSLLTH